MLLLSLPAACNAPLATQVTREAARAAVRPVLADRFPGVPLEPATDCVIDNASAGEIAGVVSASAAGDRAGAARGVLDVAGRPETLRCLAADGLPVLLNTL